MAQNNIRAGKENSNIKEEPVLHVFLSF